MEQANKNPTIPDSNSTFDTSDYTSIKTKLANNGEWWKHKIDSYLGLGNTNSEELESMMLIRDLLDGDIGYEHYKHVLDPYNQANASTKKRLKKYPAAMRHYDITNDIVNTLLGEKLAQPDLVTVFTTNDDTETEDEAEVNAVIEQELMQLVVNALNEQGVETGLDSKEVQDIDKTRTSKYATLKQKRAMVGQEVLNYLKFDLSLKDVNVELFKDYIAYRRAITYRSIINGNIVRERVDPFEIQVINNSDSPFIEDASAVIRTRYITYSSMIDKYYIELNELKNQNDNFNPFLYFEKAIRGESGTNPRYRMVNERDIQGRYEENRDSFIQEQHLVFSTLRPVYILTFVNKFGMLDEITVDEDYKLDTENGDIQLEELWVRCLFEAVKLDDIYLFGRPIEYERNDLNNLSVQKNPYGGIIKRTAKGKIYSEVVKIMQYNIIYNILRYQLEKIINKNKDKIIVLPQGLIPDKPGWDEDTTINFAEATSYLFVNEQKEKGIAALQSIKVLDASLADSIRTLWDICQGIKQDAKDSIGMTPQRMGDIQTSAGKGTTESAIVRSATITKFLFNDVRRYEEKDYNCLLDLSKYAYKDGKTGHYIGGDGVPRYLSLQGENLAVFLNTNFGTFAVDNEQLYQDLQTMKQFAFSFAQNDNDPEMIAEIVTSKDINNLKAKLKKFNAIKQQIEQSRHEDNIKTQQEQTASLEKIAQDELDFKYYQEDMDYIIATMASKSKEDITEDIKKLQYELSLRKQRHIERKDDALLKLKEKQLAQQKELRSAKK